MKDFFELRENKIFFVKVGDGRDSMTVKVKANTKGEAIKKLKAKYPKYPVSLDQNQKQGKPAGALESVELDESVKTEDKGQFIYAAKQAKAKGDSTFVFAGKTYNCEEVLENENLDESVIRKMKDFLAKLDSKVLSKNTYFRLAQMAMANKRAGDSRAVASGDKTAAKSYEDHAKRVIKELPKGYYIDYKILADVMRDVEKKGRIYASKTYDHEEVLEEVLEEDSKKATIEYVVVVKKTDRIVGVGATEKKALDSATIGSAHSGTQFNPAFEVPRDVVVRKLPKKVPSSGVLGQNYPRFVKNIDKPMGTHARHQADILARGVKMGPWNRGAINKAMAKAGIKGKMAKDFIEALRNPEK